MNEGHFAKRHGWASSSKAIDATHPALPVILANG
jgi:hypothetical protein